MQAWTGQDTEFNFGHIEPRSVDRRVRKADATHNAVGFQAAKGFNAGLIGMGNELVQNPLNTFRIGLEAIDQITHGVGKIGFGAALGEQDRALSRQRFDHHKQVPRAAPSLFVILARRVLGLQGQTDATIDQQLIAFLIEAYNGS